MNLETMNYIPEEIQEQINIEKAKKQSELEKRQSRFYEIPGGKIKRISGKLDGSYNEPHNRFCRKRAKSPIKSDFNTHTQKPDSLIYHSQKGMDHEKINTQIRRQVNRTLKELNFH